MGDGKKNPAFGKLGTNGDPVLGDTFFLGTEIFCCTEKDPIYLKYKEHV